MAEIGGKLVADRVNDRGFRSCFKEAKQGGVGHDASYTKVIELEGEISALKERLKERMNFEDGQRSTTNSALAGVRRILNLVIMSSGHPVAPCDLLWRPNRGQLWLFIRPETASSVIELVGGKIVLCSPLLFSFIGPRAGVFLASVLGGEAESVGHVRSAACFPHCYVMTGNTKDPRKNFPPKDIKERLRRLDGTEFETCPAGDSKLWDAKARAELRECRLAKKECEIPFILMTREGIPGWDVLLPASWGMAFWSSFMYAAKQRAVGLEVMQLLKLEREQPVFPEEYVDMPIAQELLRQREKDMQEAHLRRPKGKRVDFDIYEIPSPFFPDLGSIARSEAGLVEPERKKGRNEAPSICIVRGRSALSKALGHLASLLLKSASRGPQRRQKQQPREAKKEVVLREHCNLFVRVNVKPVTRGVPTANALIYEPTEEDMNCIKKNKKWGGVNHVRGKARLCVGRVLIGGFLLGGGAGGGRGVMCVSALRRMVSNEKVFVLVRNVQSLQYRVAVVSIIGYE